MAIWEQEKMPIYSKKQAQIKAQSKTWVRILLFDKVSTEVSAKYFN